MAESGPVALVSLLAPAWRNVLSLSLFSPPGQRTGHLVGTCGTRMVLHAARYWYIEDCALNRLFRGTGLEVGGRNICKRLSVGWASARARRIRTLRASCLDLYKVHSNLVHMRDTNLKLRVGPVSLYSRHGAIRERTVGHRLTWSNALPTYRLLLLWCHVI